MKHLTFIFILFISISCKNDSENINSNKTTTMESSQEKLTKFGSDYTAAWNSQNPASVATFFAENGTLIVNKGEPIVGRIKITEFVKGFMTAFPDMQLSMDSLVTLSTGTDYHWRFVGTNTGPEGTNNKVDFSGFERWTFNEDGLIKVSIGTFDEADYSRQVRGE